MVCVSVGAGGDDAERLGLKWAHPVHDVDVLDTGTSPTLSRVLAQGELDLIATLLGRIYFVRFKLCCHKGQVRPY